jgi:hypothetical protein
VPEDQRRCPNCDALVALDATWCGQCFARLEEPTDSERPGRTDAAERPGTTDGAEPTTAGSADAAVGDVARTERAAAFWPCPVCDTANPIDADACVTCGTPFAEVMRREPDRPVVDAKDAVAWSLVFPGLGHRLVGRSTDGIARGVLFAIAFSMALLTGFGGVRSGPALGVFMIFLATALGVYVLAAVEAARLANGGDLLIPSRLLLWVLVLVIFVAVAMLAVAVVTSTRR